MNPVLYVLMRNDLTSLNAGKACAQTSHAAHQCWFTLDAGRPDHKRLLRAYEAETGQGFGTTIVLGVSEAQMRETVAVAKDHGVHAGIVHDPTYPIKDGAALHVVPLDTCGYLFGYKDDLFPFVSDLDLMA